jgi:hypothetical protein
MIANAPITTSVVTAIENRNLATKSFGLSPSICLPESLDRRSSNGALSNPNRNSTSRSVRQANPPEPFLFGARFILKRNLMQPTGDGFERRGDIQSLERHIGRDNARHSNGSDDDDNELDDYAGGKEIIGA